MVYNRIMEKLEKRLQNLDNTIINDILSDEDIASVYKIIDALDEDQTVVQGRLGHKAYLTSFPEPIRQKLEKSVQDIYGQDWVLEAHQFARYSLEYGFVPKLYPHFDDAFDNHRLTLDVQLFGSRPWPLVVEGKSFTLKNNQGLVFSGTSQIHWREKFDFQQDDRFDMIFCHLHNVSDPDAEVSLEWTDSMNKRMFDWADKVQISMEEVKLDEHNRR